MLVFSFSATCSTTTPVPKAALAPTDEADIEENQDTDGNANRWMSDEEVADLCKFGPRHEVKGDLHNVRWADLEPTLPDSAITIPPSQDISKALEDSLHLECSQAHRFGESNAVMVLCSKPNQIRRYGYEDDDIEEMEELSPGSYCAEPISNDGRAYCHPCDDILVDVAYLGLTSSKDQSTKIYSIATNLNLGIIVGECSSYGIENSFDIVDVQVKPFMDTTGVYVRTRWYKTHFTEHSGHSSDDNSMTYTTWLFAGDDYRLVASWDDTTYTYEREYNEFSSDEDGEENITEEETQNYTEKYLYYESGKFSVKSQPAHSVKTLHELLSKRP